jgi:hypothetical protein
MKKYIHFIKKTKAISVTGHGCPKGCETSKLSKFLDNWPTFAGEVVSLTHWWLFTPQKDFWY